MSKYSRYLFTKRIYKDYLVFILSKNNLITYSIDLEIYNSYKDNIFNLGINYIILDNLYLNIYKFNDNKYSYYVKLNLLKKIIWKLK